MASTTSSTASPSSSRASDGPLQMTRQFLDGDGRRARLGIVVPSVNTVIEPWAQRNVPDGVSVLAARMFIPSATTAEAFVEMDRNEGKAAIRQLSSVFPDVIA